MDLAVRRADRIGGVLRLGQGLREADGIQRDPVVGHSHDLGRHRVGSIIQAASIGVRVDAASVDSQLVVRPGAVEALFVVPDHGHGRDLGVRQDLLALFFDVADTRVARDLDDLVAARHDPQDRAVEGVVADVPGSDDLSDPSAHRRAVGVDPGRHEHLDRGPAGAGLLRQLETPDVRVDDVRLVECADPFDRRVGGQVIEVPRLHAHHEGARGTNLEDPAVGAQLLFDRVEPLAGEGRRIDLDDVDLSIPAVPLAAGLSLGALGELQLRRHAPQLFLIPEVHPARRRFDAAGPRPGILRDAGDEIVAEGREVRRTRLCHRPRHARELAVGPLGETLPVRGARVGASTGPDDGGRERQDQTGRGRRKKQSPKRSEVCTTVHLEPPNEGLRTWQDLQAAIEWP